METHNQTLSDLSWGSLLEELSEKKLVEKEKVVAFLEKEETLLEGAAVRIVQTPSNPWFLRVLVGFGAWLAAIFFAISLGFMEIYRSQAAMLLFGTVSCGACAFFMRQELNEFTEQLCLAGSFVGQILLIVGLASIRTHFPEVTKIFTIIFVVEAVMILINSHSVMRFLSTVFASLALMGLFHRQNPLLIHALILVYAVFVVWGSFQLHRARTSPASQFFTTPTMELFVRALSVSLILVLVLSIMPETSRRYAVGSWMISGVGLGLLWIVATYLLWKKEQRPMNSEFFVLGIGLVAFCAASANAPGVITACLFCMLAYSLQNQLFLGTGILSLIVFLSAYYYHMNIDLLTKSIALIIPGILLLAVYRFLRMHDKNSQEASHA